MQFQLTNINTISNLCIFSLNYTNILKILSEKSQNKSIKKINLNKNSYYNSNFKYNNKYLNKKINFQKNNLCKNSHINDFTKFTSIYHQNSNNNEDIKYFTFSKLFGKNNSLKWTSKSENKKGIRYWNNKTKKFMNLKWHNTAKIISDISKEKYLICANAISNGKRDLRMKNNKCIWKLNSNKIMKCYYSTCINNNYTKFKNLMEDRNFRYINWSKLGYGQLNKNLVNSIKYMNYHDLSFLQMLNQKSYFSNDKLLNHQNLLFSTYYSNTKVNSKNYRNKANYYTNNFNRNNNKNKKNNNRKKFFKNLTERNVIYSIIGINTLVFALWQYAVEQAESYNNMKYLNFMTNNFTVSWANACKRKRWWTLLTSAFSHQEKMHFLMNIIVFNSFAPSVIQVIGPQNFLALYLFTGISSSLSHISFNHFALPLIKNQQRQMTFMDQVFPSHQRKIYDQISSLGASGAIMGINTLFACLYPNSIIQMGMFLPLPAWLAMSLYTTMDLYRTTTLTNGRIDTAGHVGGALSGLAFYLIKIKPTIQKFKNKYY